MRGGPRGGPLRAVREPGWVERGPERVRARGRSPLLLRSFLVRALLPLRVSLAGQPCRTRCGGRGRGEGAGSGSQGRGPIRRSGAPSCVAASQVRSWRSPALQTDPGCETRSALVRLCVLERMCQPVLAATALWLRACCEVAKEARGRAQGRPPCPRFCSGRRRGALAGHRTPCTPCPPASHAFSRTLCYRLALPVLSRLLTVPASESMWICTFDQGRG